MDNPQNTSQAQPSPAPVPGQTAKTPIVPSNIAISQQTPPQNTPQYSIRTMAQDLERAQKEGSLTSSAIKAPSAPPAPPKIILESTIAPRRAIVAPSAPTTQIKQPEIMPQPKPSAPIIPPPSFQKPVAPIMGIPKPSPTPPPSLPIKRSIPEISLTPPATKPYTPKAEPLPAPKPIAEIPIAPVSEMKKREFPIASKMPAKESFAPPTIPARPAPQAPSLPSFPILPAKESILAKLNVLSSIRQLPLSSFQIRMIILSFATIIVVVGVTTFSYWWFIAREEPAQVQTEEPKEEPVIAEPLLPNPITSFAQDIIIESPAKINPPEMMPVIKAQILDSSKFIKNKELGRILIKHSSQTEKAYLKIAELATYLGLTLSSSLLENISDGEILAYNQNGEMRFGIALSLNNEFATIGAMNNWEKTMLNDVSNLFIQESPVIPQDVVFRDGSLSNALIHYLNLPDQSLSLSWGILQGETSPKQNKILVIATSKEMLYNALELQEDRPLSERYPSGTLVRAKGGSKIYRIIDNEKLWIPSVKAFIDSGYAPNSEMEISAEDLNKFADVAYIQIKDSSRVYEIKDNKKYVISNLGSIDQDRIKIVSLAELNAYGTAK